MADETSNIELTAEIVANYVANNSVPIEQLPALISTISKTLASLTAPEPEASTAASEKPTASQIRKSIRDEGLVSFVDGKLYKTLKRHLAKHGLTIAAYKEKFGLSSDYPTTSPAYSARRSEMARSLGLGKSKVVAEVPAAETPKTRGRPKKAAAA